MNNLVFLTMSRIDDISRRGIYTDLLRKFRDEGWNVYILTPHERSLGKPTEIDAKNGVHILGVKTFNLQKTSTIEKGIGQVLVEGQYKRAINKYLPSVRFDLILYSTPPITFSRVIAFLKKQNPKAISYLLLKDIFPQNAVDLGMMSKSGLNGMIYRFFRRKEKMLYALSDYIGCMSPANVEYVVKHNPEVALARVEIAPNSIELRPIGTIDREAIRLKYGLPTNRPVFIYGGNLGKPQGIPFLIDCLDANGNRMDCHFVVLGDGTEQKGLMSWYDNNKPKSVTVLERLSKEDYDMLAASCDVGLIFLDHRFTFPNYPSRLLPYLENRMPVIVATDPHCDMGKIAEENGYGFWCESNSVDAFTVALEKMLHTDRSMMGERGYEFLCKNYLVQYTYNAIVKHV